MWDLLTATWNLLRACSFDRHGTEETHEALVARGDRKF